jgi:hypothetical protein
MYQMLTIYFLLHNPLFVPWHVFYVNINPTYLNFFVQQKNAPFYENTCSLDELDEKPNHTKISKSWNFEGKGYKAKDSFLKPFDKIKMFNGFKMSSFRCRSHVQELILPKNMFGCPLKLILGFLKIFCIFGIKLKYSFKHNGNLESKR